MAASSIVITYDGTDITESVLFATATFEMQVNAIPGEFSFSCKDEDQMLEFITGKEVTLDVDGFRLWGGYLMQVGSSYAFDADAIPANPDNYKNRQWNLRGVDYNILFDKRVINDSSNPPSSYLSSIDTGLPGATTPDGTALKYVLAHYVDGLTGFDITNDLDDVRTVMPSTADDNYIIQQGQKLRDIFHTLSLRSGAVWYISPTKAFQWHSLESVQASWGLSDDPSYPVTIGPRAIQATEDGSFIINDALIWGGSQFAGPAGGTVFARAEDSGTGSSQDIHGRWQLAETHFGESGYGIQDGVDARADVIVNGLPGANALGQLKGLRYSQWSFSLDWFAHDVPLIGAPNHLLPGDLVVIELKVFGFTGATVKLLPLRTLRIRFPNLAPSGDSYVQFSGEFALNLSDPFTLWRYILQAQKRAGQTIIATSTSDDSSTSFQYGSFGQFTPTPVPDGTTTVFALPIGYIAGTLQIKLNGLDQVPGISFTESDPNGGHFTMIPAPLSTDTLYAFCRTLEG